MIAAVGSEWLVVAEQFGPTVQGEGPSAGVPAVFVRLSRCNLACVWCDTPYTWDWARFDPRAESRVCTVQEVAGWVLDRPARLVVVTGGEPLLQMRPLARLVGQLTGAGRLVEVETNGTRPPAPGLVEAGAWFNVSPKLASSGMPEHRRIVPAALSPRCRRWSPSGGHGSSSSYGTPRLGRGRRIGGPVRADAGVDHA